MKNRNVEFFNLSFLDLLSGALAAVIFLFIIVPKGEITIHDDPVTVIYDTIQNRLYADIPEDFPSKGTGDTVLAIIGNLEGVKIAEEDEEQLETPEGITQRPRSPREKTKKQTQSKEEVKEDEPTEKIAATPVTVKPAELKGSRPNVPCVLSIEVKWANKKDNVDLYVCKDDVCVYGRTRYRPNIGSWDSGKSKTRLFGADLRTNQEAVRQFDSIIPGTYDIRVQFKESSDSKPDIPIRLQVYTKNEDGTERGDEHYFKLKLDPYNQTRVARLIVGPNGEIEFQTFK